MKKINIGSNIKIYWKIWRGANKVSEDFNSMNTNLKVFLVGSGDTYYLEPSINNTIDPGYDVIELDIPAFRLDVGVYNIKAIWEKNGGRNVLTSARASVLYLTDSPSEAHIQDEEVRIVSLVESFGRDGMSAYETAVMRGVNEGITSEIEWVKSVSIFNEKERLANEEERISNEDDRIANEADRIVAEKRRELFKEGLLEQVNNYKPIEITGDVTNAADEEDITSDENNLLKLKDRTPINGMGYKILRIGKPLQEQMSLPNTIYEIRYNFVLDNGTLNIPEECILKYNGGSFSNGHIVYNNTTIVGVENVYNITSEGEYKYFFDERVDDKIREIDNSISLKLNQMNSELSENISASESRTNSNLRNLADGEDLYSYNDRDNICRIEFRDREIGEEVEGYNYVILRKTNKKTGDPLSFSRQLKKENTIYEIRYDFDLGGERVYIPNNSVLKFNGGFLHNGTIVGKKTLIDADKTKIFGLDVYFEKYKEEIDNGKDYAYPNAFINNSIFPEWFGAVGDGLVDDSSAINKAVKVGYDLSRDIVLSNAAYAIESPIIIGSGVKLRGNNVVGKYSTNTKIVVKQNVHAIEINNIKLFNNNITYYTNIHIENITIDGNLLGGNGIHYDGMETGSNRKVFQFCKFHNIYIKNCRYGMYVNLVDADRDGWLYTDFYNVVFSDNIIGLFFDGSSFINLNSFTKCYFSASNLSGLRMCGSTLENNRFTDCSFEGNGNEYTDEISDYGSSGCTFIGSKGYNILENCYFEFNYPRRKVSGSTVKYSLMDDNFYVAQIVCQGVTLCLTRNLFASYYRGVNIGKNHCGLELQFNDYWNPTSNSDGLMAKSFIKIFNKKFGNPQYGYQKFLLLDGPRPSVDNPQYAYEFEDNSLYGVDVINYSISDYSSFKKTTNIVVRDTTIKSDHCNYFIDGDVVNNGCGLFEDSPVKYLEDVKKVSYFRGVKEKVINILRNCGTGNQNSNKLTGDKCIIKGETGGEILTFEAYVYGWEIDTIIFEDLHIRLKSYQNFRLDGARTVIFNNCTIEYPSTTGDARLLQTNSNTFTDIYFNGCTVIAGNSDANSFYLVGGNLSLFKIHLNNTTIPENIKALDRDNFDFYNQTSAVSVKDGYIGYDSKIGAFVYKNGGVWSILPSISYTQRTGTFANRPTTSPKGSSYFCTDRSTVEGENQGITIFHKGDDVWVDALGRIVT